MRHDVFVKCQSSDSRPTFTSLKGIVKKTSSWLMAQRLLRLATNNCCKKLSGSLSRDVSLYQRDLNTKVTFVTNSFEFKSQMTKITFPWKLKHSGRICSDKMVQLYNFIANVLNIQNIHVYPNIITSFKKFLMIYVCIVNFDRRLVKI